MESVCSLSGLIHAVNRGRFVIFRGKLNTEDPYNHFICEELKLKWSLPFEKHTQVKVKK